MNPFPAPLMFAAWGTAPGGGGTSWSGPTGLAAACKQAGYRSVAVEIGSIDAAGIRDIRDMGLYTVIWNVVDGTLADVVDELRPDGVMPQIEGPGQYDGCVAGLQALKARGIVVVPLAVVTTFWGLYDPTNDTTIRSGSKWKTLRELGVSAAYVESYAADGFDDYWPHVQWGQRIGISAAELVPVFGAYRGEMPASYIDTQKAQRTYGVYLAEEMSAAQITAWGGLNKVTTVLYWQLIDNATGRVVHEERATTWIENGVQVTGLQKCIDWLGANMPTVRVSGDYELKRVSH